jgi:acyl carrier protein
MKKEEIAEKMTEIFRHIFENDNMVLSDDMTPDTVENWASLTHMQMITALQENFGVKFSIKDQLKLMRVGDIISLLEEKLG